MTNLLNTLCECFKYTYKLCTVLFYALDTGLQIETTE